MLFKNQTTNMSCRSAADLTEAPCASERDLAMGGGRPAESRFTVGGSGKSVARCHRTVLAYWKFESISLQQGVCKLSVPRASPTASCALSGDMKIGQPRIPGGIAEAFSEVNG